MPAVGGLLVAAVAAALAAQAPPELDAARWADLNEAGRAAFGVESVSDAVRHGRDDHWVVADAKGGDCEDKALLARALLLARGWPAASLRLALVWTEVGEYHAVLTVDVVRGGAPGTYVVDPRFPRAVGWETLTRLGYRWDRRQAADGAGWRRIGG